jgi:hypothetical protein
VRDRFQIAAHLRVAAGRCGRRRSAGRALTGLIATLVVAALVVAPSAQAAFGFLPGAEGFDVTATEADGSPATQAGSHPYEITTTVDFNIAPGSESEPGGPYTEGDLKDLQVELPPGLIENPTAVPRCSLAAFHTPRSSPFQQSLSGESCPDDTQIGVVAIHSSFGGGTTRSFGVFNLTPPPGAPSQLGFSPFGTPITFTPEVREAGGEYGLTLQTQNFSQRFDLFGLRLTIWGDPWLLPHDPERGNCLNEVEPASPFGEAGTVGGGAYHPGTCSATKAPASGEPKFQPPKAYLTLPSSCSGPIAFAATADSWQQPGAVVAASSTYHDEGGDPLGLVDCPALNTIATITPGTDRTTTPTGLGFDFAAAQNGFVENVTGEDVVEPEARASSPVRKAVVSLPEGMSINPSLAAGLGVCTEAAYAAETATSPPGAGCPNVSKIGDVTIASPLVEGGLQGSVFLAEPDDRANSLPGAENPFDSLLAIYVVAKAPERGLMVKLAGKLEADPTTGRLTATFDGLPQLPYTDFDIHFRSGQRSPLASPPTCGGYVAPVELTLWADPGATFRDISSFFIDKGIGGEGCPSGTAPFTPTASGGALNSFAGAYTPFYLHLTRTDEQQEITSYSATLPPGMLANLSGVARCPDAAIEAAKAGSGTRTEDEPPCPAGSLVGHTISGYGVGSALAYAPGRLYLAGPYHGHPLSLVAIDSAKVGPFDLGTIVVRFAFSVNPLTAQLRLDSSGSDPIPHIIDGIPIHLRDVRIYIDRPEFTVNPTDCGPLSYTSTLTGSAAPFTNPTTATATITNPFQVSDCSALRFAPKLGLKLKGPSRRGGYPSLRATLSAHPGDANIARAQVTLPPSEFLAQEHIREVCSRPEAEREACPPSSIYGHAVAVTPLLGEPLTGPVYLRSSSNTLPDLFVPLSGGGIDIDLDGRIDSRHGGIRATFEGLPDAPLTRFTMTLDGGHKGLLINSADTCKATQPALARLVGQSNQGEIVKPPLHAECAKARRRAHPRTAHHRKKRSPR